MAKIQQLIGRFEVQDAMAFRNLTIFPLVGQTTNSRSYITLADALQSGEFKITEVNEGSRVPEVRVENLGSSPVLLLDGEELLGAMQNRILNLTIMIPAKSNVNIPVSCVEAGRWSHGSRNFKDAGRTGYASLRARKAAQVSENLNMGNSREADQRAIWQDLAAKASRMRASSPTRAMAGMYEAHGDALEKFGKNIRPIPEQCGVIFAIGGTVTGMDLFDHPETFRELFPKLLHGYALDAIDQEQQISTVPLKTIAEDFVSEVAAVSEVKNFCAVGLGTDIRFQGRRVTGSALDALDGIGQLCAFALSPSSAYGGDDDGSVPRTLRSSLRRLWRVCRAMNR